LIFIRPLGRSLKSEKRKSVIAKYNIKSPLTKCLDPSFMSSEESEGEVFKVLPFKKRSKTLIKFLKFLDIKKK